MKGNDSLIERLVELERQGINVTIGSGALLFQKKKRYGIRLWWESPNHWTSGLPSGSMSDDAEFDDYAEFDMVFGDTIERFKARIATFLQGAAI